MRNGKKLKSVCRRWLKCRAFWGLCLGTQTGWAGDICQMLKGQSSILNPCSGERAHAVPGGAYPSFSDSFNLNAASLPTFPTPVGVEVIASSNGWESTGSQYNVALLKGFEKFGAGLSANSGNSFFNSESSLYDAASQVTQAESLNTGRYLVPVVNLGSSYEVPGVKADDLFFKPILGTTARYNHWYGKWGMGAGLSLGIEWFTLGAGYNYDRRGEENTPEYTLSVAFKRAGFNADLSRVISQNSLGRFRSNILTLTYAGEKWLASAAYRDSLSDFNYTLYKTSLWMGMFQFSVLEFLRVGYLYNYIPGLHSVGAQIYFL